MDKQEELEKSKVYNTIEVIDYELGSIQLKTVVKKNTGSITFASLDSGETLTEKTSPFDYFVQVISGTAEIMIRDQSYPIKSGQCIVLPAHMNNTIKATSQSKMISTVIKSGYEEVI